MSEETLFHGVLVEPAVNHAVFLKQAFVGKPEGTGLCAFRRSM